MEALTDMLVRLALSPGSWAPCKVYPGRTRMNVDYTDVKCDVQQPKTCIFNWVEGENICLTQLKDLGDVGGLEALNELLFFPSSSLLLTSSSSVFPSW